jgi:hypothetical protein
MSSTRPRTASITSTVRVRLDIRIGVGGGCPRIGCAASECLYFCLIACSSDRLARSVCSGWESSASWSVIQLGGIDRHGVRGCSLRPDRDLRPRPGDRRCPGAPAAVRQRACVAPRLDLRDAARLLHNLAAQSPRLISQHTNPTEHDHAEVLRAEEKGVDKVPSYQGVNSPEACGCKYGTGIRRAPPLHRHGGFDDNGYLKEVRLEVWRADQHKSYG